MNAKDIEDIDTGRATDLLREKILECGVSRAEIARRLGLSRSAVSNALRKGRDLNVRTVVRFLDACGYDLVMTAVWRNKGSRRERLIAEAKGEAQE